MIHCRREETNSSHSTDLVSFAECPPSNVSKRFSRTLDLQSGPEGLILDAQYHIFRGVASGRSSTSLIVFQGHSSTFEAPMPLKILRTIHCLVAVCLTKHI